MPREWYDRHAVNQIEDDEKRRFYLSIVADRKPYFMRYIYQTVMKEHRDYVKCAEKNSAREFRLSISELENLPKQSMTEHQNDFLRYYYARMPVGLGDCVMNRICRRFEQEFDGYLRRQNGQEPFDYTFMKSGSAYSKSQKTAIKKLFDTYNENLQKYMVYASYERVDEYDSMVQRAQMHEAFIRECDLVCPSSATLCDLVLDICYKSNSTKRFAWDMSGSEIIKTLLRINNRTIRYPTVDEDGDITYAGNTFTMKELIMEEEFNEHNPE